MSSEVRVRFAPSPTGSLHIGGVRTALFNWLFARQKGGTFILRIEDTDRDRSTDEAIQIILDSLEWTGLNWDEGPYRQTDRLELYRQYAMTLLEQGKAYWCVCTPEELEIRRKDAQARGDSIHYDGRCREKGLHNPPEPAALRFRSPQVGQTVIDDLIKGRIVFENQVLDDLILLRSNGYATYNFSVVIDDALMKMSHVIRGDDHVNNTPRQVTLFEALGFPVPQFAHLPMILGSDKSRLSKRHGAMSVLAYREMGYLPEALVNYLVRLGWSHGDQEIFSRQEMIDWFSFDHVQSSPAVFNPEKLRWLNAQYIRSSDPHHVAIYLTPHLKKEGYDETAFSRIPGGVEGLVSPLRERSETLLDMVNGAAPYLADTITLEESAAKKFLTPPIASSLKKFADRVEAEGAFNKEVLERILKEILEEDGLKMGKLAQPIRVALTGGTVSPGIYEVMELLGKTRTLDRLQAAMAQMKPG
ncbi:MAG: glutamate--tRNA ligase [Nitrospirales bacterium]|nr:glutamate--tRNA ligase [Nitrospira sp.]MDR4502041.1 glutamate--tRNA ligase [Nitrospirales bacterium]